MNSNAKILVVDDEPDLRDIIVDELSSFKTLQAADGREALKILSHQSVDLVITDINMPHLDGLKLLEAIRKQNLKMPVIIVTGYGDLEKMRRAWSLGAFDFLSKPIDFSKLNSTVRMALVFGAEIHSLKAADTAQITVPTAVADNLEHIAKTLGKSSNELIAEWINAAIKKSKVA